jgi:hypothetical protein
MAALENQLESAIYSILKGGTALTTLLGGTAIYLGQPPRDVALPWVTVQMVAGIEDNRTRVRTTNYTYLIKGVAPSLLAAGSIASAIDDLVHDQRGYALAGGTAFWSTRQLVVRYQEIDPAGHVIGHSGGEYSFRVE